LYFLKEALTPSREDYVVNGTVTLIEPGFTSRVAFLVANETVANITQEQSYNGTVQTYAFQTGITDEYNFTLHGLNYDGDYYFMFQNSGSYNQEIELTISEYWNAVVSEPNSAGVIIAFCLFPSGIFLLLTRPKTRRKRRI
jgi:hypothetical protein